MVTLKLATTVATAVGLGRLAGFRGQNIHGTFEALTEAVVRLRVGSLVVESTLRPGTVLDLSEVAQFRLVSGVGIALPRRPAKVAGEILSARTARLRNARFPR